jgi:pentatricopeptide repeat protein
MNSLVDMYAKCREIEFACQLFERISERDVISWSAMISGCAKNGAADEALILFNRMQQAGIKPNLITMAISIMDMPMRR